MTTTRFSVVRCPAPLGPVVVLWAACWPSLCPALRCLVAPGTLERACARLIVPHVVARRYVFFFSVGRVGLAHTWRWKASYGTGVRPWPGVPGSH